jgi:hypothetical protein
MEQALNDENSHVRSAAVSSPHFKPEHMEQALNDKDPHVRHLAESMNKASTLEASLRKLSNNVEKINELIKTLDTTGGPLYHIHKDGYRVTSEPLSVRQIDSVHGGVKKLEASGHVLVPYDKSKVNKALTAGYSGASAPTSRTGGSVLQTEHLDLGRGFKYIKCNGCGDEQVYMQHQVKCRKCQQHFPMADLYKLMVKH